MTFYKAHNHCHYQENVCRLECLNEPDCEFYTWYGEGDPLEHLCVLLTSCPHTLTSCSHCHSGPARCQQDLSDSSTSLPSSTTEPLDHMALVISGGYGAGSSVEVFLPQES